MEIEKDSEADASGGRHTDDGRQAWPSLAGRLVPQPTGTGSDTNIWDQLRKSVRKRGEDSLVKTTEKKTKRLGACNFHPQ